MNVIKRSERLVRLQITLLRIINMPVTVCVKVNQLYAIGRNDKNEVGVKTEIKVRLIRYIRLTSYCYLLRSITSKAIATNTISLSKKKLVIKTPSTTFHVFGVVIMKLSVVIKVNRAKRPDR